MTSASLPGVSEPHTFIRPHGLGTAQGCGNAAAAMFFDAAEKVCIIVQTIAPSPQRQWLLGSQPIPSAHLIFKRMMASHQCDTVVAQERNVVIVQCVHMCGLQVRPEQTHLFQQLNAIAAMALLHRKHVSERNSGAAAPARRDLAPKA